MKMSFLLSVAAGIAGVILTAVLWTILNSMGVFADIERTLRSFQSTGDNPLSIQDFVGIGRMLSLSVVISVINVILMTAIATVMAFLYNICASLVGGPARRQSALEKRGVLGRPISGISSSGMAPNSSVNSS